MNVTVERLPECRASLRVEVPGADVTKEREKILNAYVAQAKIPGFRPGKTPRAVVLKHYRKPINEELQERLVRAGCDEATEKEKLEILGVAKVENQLFHEDDAFSFTAEVVVSPDFTLPEYKGIAVQVPTIEVTEDGIDRILGNVLERFSEFKDVEGRPLQENDFAVISYSATLDGQPLQEAIPDAPAGLVGVEEYWLKVAPDEFIPGFCEQITGMNVGDKKDLTITLPEDFSVESLQGKELAYAVELKNIKEQSIPELTDEIAGQIDPGKTAAELRQTIRESLGAEQESMRKDMITNQILSHISEATEFDIPQHLLYSETQRQVNGIVQENQRRGIDDNEIMEHQDEILENAEVRAKLNVKTTFILERIAEAEKISVVENEIIQSVLSMAERSGRPPKKLIKEIQKSEGFGRIANQIRIAKTLEFLRANAAITEVEPSPADAEDPAGALAAATTSTPEAEPEEKASS